MSIWSFNQKIPFFTVSSGVYLWYVVHLVLGETALEHVGLQFAPPSAPHTLVSDTNFLSREKEELLTSGGVYKYLSLVLVPSTWVASWPSAAGFNIGEI